MTDQDLFNAADAICNELANALMDKGIVNPTAAFERQSGGGGYVRLSGDNFPHPGYEYFYGDTALTAARAYIAAMPDPATIALTSHTRRLADCIDKGRADGIDEGLLPIQQMAKASTMLLTKTVA